MACEKSMTVEAVSISGPGGETHALQGDPLRIDVSDENLEMPTQIAFKATGEDLQTGWAMDLVTYEMLVKQGSACSIAKEGACSGEVCTAIIHWQAPGWCSFNTSIEDDAGNYVSSCTTRYVGPDADNAPEITRLPTCGFEIVATTE